MGQRVDAGLTADSKLCSPGVPDLARDGASFAFAAAVQFRSAPVSPSASLRSAIEQITHEPRLRSSRHSAALREIVRQRCGRCWLRCPRAGGGTQLHHESASATSAISPCSSRSGSHFAIHTARKDVLFQVAPPRRVRYGPRIHGSGCFCRSVSRTQRHSPSTHQRQLHDCLVLCALRLAVQHRRPTVTKNGIYPASGFIPLRLQLDADQRRFGGCKSAVALYSER